MYASNPECWDGDGGQLGQGMGGSGNANVFGTDIVNVSSGTCPGSNPDPIPGMVVAMAIGPNGLTQSNGTNTYTACLTSDVTDAGGVAYPNAGYNTCDAASGAYIGAGAGYSEHADFVFGFTTSEIAAIDEYCLDPQFGLSGNIVTTCQYNATGSSGPGIYTTRSGGVGFVTN